MFIVAFLKAWYCFSVQITDLKETPGLQYSSVPVYVTFVLRLLGFCFQSARISTVYTFKKKSISKRSEVHIESQRARISLWDL